MTRVILDSTLLAHLPALDGQVEFCNEAGERAGVYLPVADWERLIYAWAQAEFTDEEIEQARNEEGGRALSEFLAELPKE